MNDDLLRYIAECEGDALAQQACLKKLDDDCHEEDLAFEPDEFEELDDNW